MSSESSGTTYCVPHLCESLIHAGANVQLHMLAPLYDIRHDGYEMFSYPRLKFPHPAFGRSPQMKKGLIEAGAWADIIQSNGLWMAPNIYPYCAAKKNGKKLVVMPHGMFLKWGLKQSVLKKKLCWWAGQGSAMRHADMFIVTSQEEYETLRELNFRQPVTLLPNGIDIPMTTYPKANRRIMLFLSRIHPKKGLQMLIPAWKKLQDDFPDWDLKIAGPNNAHAEEMKMLAKTLHCERVDFCGEIVGEEKTQLLSQSECLILPTFSENFGMVVAEALAAESCAICTRNAPWEGLNENQCGISCDGNEAAIQEAMRSIMTSSREENIERGRRGKAWMLRDFSWDIIGKKTLDAFQWLLGKAEKPEWVRND